MKMELTEGSETSAYINQTPGNYPKGNLLYSVHGKSLKSRKVHIYLPTESQILFTMPHCKCAHTQFCSSKSDLPFFGQPVPSVNATILHNVTTHIPSRRTVTRPSATVKCFCMVTNVVAVSTAEILQAGIASVSTTQQYWFCSNCKI